MTSDTPVRKPRAFRLALVILLAVVLAAASLVYFLPHLLPMETIRNLVTARVREASGMDFDFRSFRFNWAGGVLVEGITLAVPAQEGASEAPTPLVTVDEVSVDVAIRPLLSGKVVVNRIAVNGFSLRVRRDPAGVVHLPPIPAAHASSPAPSEAGDPQPTDGTGLPHMPEIEVRLVELNRGTLAFVDEATPMEAELGLEFLKIEGGALDAPFAVSGRLIPYHSSVSRGSIAVQGIARLVKDLAFDPEGEAQFDIALEQLPVAEYAAKFSLQDLVPSGDISGAVSVAYKGQAVRAALSGFTLAGAAVNAGGEKPFAIPDTVIDGVADYKVGDDRIVLSGLNAANNVEKITGEGWIGGIADVAAGGMPHGEIDFRGTADIGAGLRLLAELLPPGTVLPDLGGDAAFSGKATLSRRQGAEPPAAAMALNFDSGQAEIREIIPGGTVTATLEGVGAQAVVKFSDPLDVAASVNFERFPVAALLPEFASPVAVSLKGGVAATSAGENLTAEVRLLDTSVDVPASPWSGAMRLSSPEARLVFDMGRDTLDIAAVQVVINDAIKAGIRAGRFTGITSGNPEGGLDAELSLPLDAARAVAGPLLPGGLQTLTGSIRAEARAALKEGRAELGVNLAVDALAAMLTEEQMQFALEAPKTVIGLSATTALSSGFNIRLNDLKVSNGGLVARFAAGDEAAAARLGETELQIAGGFDAERNAVDVTAFGVKSGGLSMGLFHGGVQNATLTSGAWIARTGVSREQPIEVPLSGLTDFRLPDIEASVDNLVFGQRKDGETGNSNLGNVRLKVGVDGYLGQATPAGDKYPSITVRDLEFQAFPVSARARGGIRLDTNSIRMDYAARFEPGRIKSLLEYFQIPPDLLRSAEASGSFTWDGSSLSAKGVAKGGLQFEAGSVSPFTVTHDFSASYSTGAEEAEIAIRGLAGSVANANGEAIISLNARPSTLSVGKAGATGSLDLRVNGAAAPVRAMALGAARLIPDLREIADVMQTAQADGVFQTWAQLQGKDNRTAVLNLGGVWQGASLRIQDTQFLAEPGELGASLTGEYDYGQRRLSISKLFLKSDSGQVRAEGSAGAVIDLDPAGAVTGMSQISAAFRFVMGDLARLATAFPGLIPSDLAASGRIDGEFKAGGDTNRLGIEQGIVRFSNVNAKPGGRTVGIANGEASYGAVLGLNPSGSYAVDGSEFEFMRIFNVADGVCSLTGAVVDGRSVSDLSAAFQLQNGVFTLNSAALALAGEPVGHVKAVGRVDFTRAKPAVDLKVAIADLPLAQFNNEIRDFVSIQSGSVNLPARQGSAAGVKFTGFTEDDILRTLAVDNFNFGTGVVVLDTGPQINAELDRARLLLKQEPKGNDSPDRVFSFRSITGTVMADGSGVIVIPKDAPLAVIGDNTGDFSISGEVRADHTINLEAGVVGQLEKILTFSLPSIIPNLRQQSAEQQSQFMGRLNQNAANGHYMVRVQGPLDNPQIAGIPELVARLLTDIPLAAPFAVIGGVLNLGKEAPGALLNAPENIGRGIGSIIDTLGAAAAQTGDGQTSGSGQQQGQQQALPNMLRGLFGSGGQ